LKGFLVVDIFQRFVFRKPKHDGVYEKGLKLNLAPGVKTRFVDIYFEDYL
jgi:hypothetical protein